MIKHQYQYPTMVLVRAQIVRVVGATKDGEARFRQKPNDRRRYDRFDEDMEGWPGAAVPLDWVEAPAEDWVLEPWPNGHAVVRCRRIEYVPPQSGVVIGRTMLHEGTIVNDEIPDQSWFQGMQVDQRQVGLYEIAMAPNGARGGYAGRARIILAHPHDVTKLPGQTLYAQKFEASTP